MRTTAGDSRCWRPFGRPHRYSLPATQALSDPLNLNLMTCAFVVQASPAVCDAAVPAGAFSLFGNVSASHLPPHTYTDLADGVTLVLGTRFMLRPGFESCALTAFRYLRSAPPLPL